MDIKLVDAATMEKNKAAAAIAPRSHLKTFCLVQPSDEYRNLRPLPNLLCGLKYAKLEMKEGDAIDSTTSSVLVTGYAFGKFCNAGSKDGDRVDLTFGGKKEINEESHCVW